MANTGKFETYKTTTGKFRWRLVAPNGKVVATSADGYDSEALARRAAKAAKDRAGKAEVVEKAAAPAAAAAKPAAKRAVTKAKPAAKKVVVAAKPAAKRAGAAARRPAAGAPRRAS